MILPPLKTGDWKPAFPALRVDNCSRPTFWAPNRPNLILKGQPLFRMDARALEGIEEIAEQTSIRVNERGRRGKFGWGVSPNIARASVVREQKKAPQKKAPRKRVSKKKTLRPITAKSPPSAARAASVGQLFTGYSTLIETCRARADELGISRLELDRLAGLPAGYSGKLLGRDGCGPRQKRAWPVSLDAMLGALGLQVILIEDPVATARTLALRTPVDRANQRFRNVCRISATLLPPPSQSASPPLLTVVAAKRSARGGKYG
jgi:hypothetical protein